MIQGFFREPSAFPDTDVSLYVATDAPQFRVDFYRQGATFDWRLSTDWTDGAASSGQDHQPSDDWGADGTGVDAVGNPSGFAAGWNSLTIRVPDDWQSGVYIAILVEGDGSGNARAPLPDFANGDARDGKAMLVVKNPDAGYDSQVLYKIPLFTYQSYNSGNRFAKIPQPPYYEPSSIYQGVDVSLRRPGGGTGGTPWDVWNFDPWDNLPAGSPRQTFQHWDAKLISWLEEVGYRIDYCTDWDVHADDAPSMLSCYSVVLSVGHDEYYSAPMREHLEGFLDSGGNVAFFSGNTCWWRTEIDADQPFVMHGQQTIQNWYALGQPEDSLTGVSFRNAGEGNGNRASIGYTVQHTDQWPFEGVGLSDGDIIGGDDALVGYECDGAPYDKNGPFPFEAVIDPAVGTPANLLILGTADIANIIADNAYGGAVKGNGGATMAMYSRNGTVFTGATTDWPRVAALGDGRVGAITRNVIDRMGGNPKGLADLSRFDGVIACDGFFSGDDDFRHAIVGTEDGAISEIFFNPTEGQGQTILATHEGLLDVAAFYSADDQYRHVIAVLESGDVVEVFYNPETGIGNTTLSNITGAKRVAAFYTPDDNYRHAIVATDDGEIIEIFFNPTTGQGQVQLGRFADIVDIGAFFSADDGYRHVLVGTSDGNITEIFYNPETGIGQSIVANIPGLSRISAYFASGDGFFNRRVQVSTVQGKLYEVRYHPRFGVMQALIINVDDIVDVGGFYSADDDFRHAIIASQAAGVQELYFRP